MDKDKLVRAIQIQGEIGKLSPFVNAAEQSEQRRTTSVSMFYCKLGSEFRDDQYAGLPEEWDKLVREEYAIAQDRIIRLMEKRIKQLNKEFDSL